MTRSFALRNQWGHAHDGGFAPCFHQQRPGFNPSTQPAGCFKKVVA
jgi:hypothetical protein